jgi:hypothetical protein
MIIDILDIIKLELHMVRVFKSMWRGQSSTRTLAHEVSKSVYTFINLVIRPDALMGSHNIL